MKISREIFKVRKYIERGISIYTYFTLRKLNETKILSLWRQNICEGRIENEMK